MGPDKDRILLIFRNLCIAACQPWFKVRLFYLTSAIRWLQASAFSLSLCLIPGNFINLRNFCIDRVRRGAKALLLNWGKTWGLLLVRNKPPISIRIELSIKHSRGKVHPTCHPFVKQAQNRRPGLSPLMPLNVQDILHIKCKLLWTMHRLEPITSKRRAFIKRLRPFIQSSLLNYCEVVQTSWYDFTFVYFWCFYFVKLFVDTISIIIIANVFLEALGRLLARSVRLMWSASGVPFSGRKQLTRRKFQVKSQRLLKREWKKINLYP